jgi:hypothetical protein
MTHITGKRNKSIFDRDLAARENELYKDIVKQEAVPQKEEPKQETKTLETKANLVHLCDMPRGRYRWMPAEDGVFTITELTDIGITVGHRYKLYSDFGAKGEFKTIDKEQLIHHPDTVFHPYYEGIITEHQTGLMKKRVFTAHTEHDQKIELCRTGKGLALPFDNGIAVLEGLLSKELVLYRDSGKKTVLFREKTLGGKIVDAKICNDTLVVSHRRSGYKPGTVELAVPNSYIRPMTCLTKWDIYKNGVIIQNEENLIISPFSCANKRGEFFNLDDHVVWRPCDRGVILTVPDKHKTLRHYLHTEDGKHIELYQGPETNSIPYKDGVIVQNEDDLIACFEGKQDVIFHGKPDRYELYNNGLILQNQGVPETDKLHALKIERK